MTGVRAAMLPSDARLAAANRVFQRAGTFSDLPHANGLAELAVNLGRADVDLGLAIGARVEIVP
jgi:hypothetical protein